MQKASSVGGTRSCSLCHPLPFSRPSLPCITLPLSFQKIKPAPVTWMLLQRLLEGAAGGYLVSSLAISCT